MLFESAVVSIQRYIMLRCCLFRITDILFSDMQIIRQCISWYSGIQSYYYIYSIVFCIIVLYITLILSSDFSVLFSDTLLIPECISWYPGIQNYCIYFIVFCIIIMYITLLSSVFFTYSVSIIILHVTQFFFSYLLLY